MTAEFQVQKAGLTGTNWTTYGKVGTGTGQFGSTAAIALDSNGRIYIADPPNQRIVQIDDITGTGFTPSPTGLAEATLPPRSATPGLLRLIGG